MENSSQPLKKGSEQQQKEIQSLQTDINIEQQTINSDILNTKIGLFNEKDHFNLMAISQKPDNNSLVELELQNKLTNQQSKINQVITFEDDAPAIHGSYKAQKTIGEVEKQLSNIELTHKTNQALCQNNISEKFLKMLSKNKKLDYCQSHFKENLQNSKKLTFYQAALLTIELKKYIQKRNSEQKAVEKIRSTQKNVFSTLNDLCFSFSFYEQLLYYIKLNKSNPHIGHTIYQDSNFNDLSLANYSKSPTSVKRRTNILRQTRKKSSFGSPKKSPLKPEIYKIQHRASIPSFSVEPLSQKILNKFIYLWYKVPTIQPNQKFKILADCWQSFWVVYRMFFTTVKLSFFIFDMKSSVNLIDNFTVMIINLSFIFDMMLSFHTGYYEKGIIIEDKKLIAIKYVKTALLSDILVQIPLFTAYFVYPYSDNSFIVAAYILEFLIFLKLLNLRNTFSRLERVFTENQTVAEIFPLITLQVQVLLMAHIVGLFYNGVAEFEIQYFQEDKTWLHTTNLIDKSWSHKYIHCLYWSISTMVTILLYLPQTNAETIYSIAAIFIMTGCFGYALNLIGIIIQDMNKFKKEYESQRQIANRMFKKRKIPEKLRERVTLYLEFAFQQQREKNFDQEEVILNKLSSQLKKEIMREINQNYISKFDFLIKHFSKETQDDILQIITEVHYSPADLIVQNPIFSNQQKGAENIMTDLYVVGKGKVELFVQRDKINKENHMQTIEEDGYFGLEAFLSDQEISYNVRSLESCIILKIDRSNFLQIVENNSHDYQIFCMMRDQFLYKNTSDLIPFKCGICYKEGHQPQECSENHFIPDKKKTIFNYKLGYTQIRCVLPKRSNYKSYNAYYFMEEVQQFAHELLDQNEDIETKNALMNLSEYYQQIQDLYNDEVLEERKNSICSLSKNSRKQSILIKGNFSNNRRQSHISNFKRENQRQSHDDMRQNQPSTTEFGEQKIGQNNVNIKQNNRINQLRKEKKLNSVIVHQYQGQSADQIESPTLEKQTVRSRKSTDVQYKQKCNQIQQQQQQQQQNMNEILDLPHKEQQKNYIKNICSSTSFKVHTNNHKIQQQNNNSNQAPSASGTAQINVDPAITKSVQFSNCYQKQTQQHQQQQQSPVSCNKLQQIQPVFFQQPNLQQQFNSYTDLQIMTPEIVPQSSHGVKEVNNSCNNNNNQNTIFSEFDLMGQSSQLNKRVKDNILGENAKSDELCKNIEEAEWDLQNFDKPKIYKFYMPYNNWTSFSIISNPLIDEINQNGHFLLNSKQSIAQQRANRKSINFKVTDFKGLNIRKGRGSVSVSSYSEYKSKLIRCSRKPTEIESPFMLNNQIVNKHQRSPQLSLFQDQSPLRLHHKYSMHIMKTEDLDNNNNNPQSFISIKPIQKE